MSKKRARPSESHYATLTHHQPLDDVSDFVLSATDELGIECTVFESVERFKNSTIVHFVSNTDLGLFIDFLISSYETLGMNIEKPVDIYDMTVYTSCPELNAYYTQTRLNLNQSSFEAFSDIISEETKNRENVRSIVNHIDGLNTLNGVYKMRKILQALVDALENANIPIADRMNKLIIESVH